MISKHDRKIIDEVDAIQCKAAIRQLKEYSPHWAERQSFEHALANLEASFEASENAKEHEKVAKP